jgi:hypothetical protein
MRVICVSVQDPTMSNNSYGFITIGKCYYVFSEHVYNRDETVEFNKSYVKDYKRRNVNIPEYQIINDHGLLTTYPQQCFKSISLIRENKLTSLGI